MASDATRTLSHLTTSTPSSPQTISSPSHTPRIVSVPAAPLAAYVHPLIRPLSVASATCSARSRECLGVLRETSMRWSKRRRADGRTIGCG